MIRGQIVFVDNDSQTVELKEILFDCLGRPIYPLFGELVKFNDEIYSVYEVVWDLEKSELTVKARKISQNPSMDEAETITKIYNAIRNRGLDHLMTREVIDAILEEGFVFQKRG